MTRERPCAHCGCTPLHHSADYMTCFEVVLTFTSGNDRPTQRSGRWLRTQYAPPDKQGTIPAHKPASMAHLCTFPNGVDDATVISLHKQMMAARASRDYKLADSIRDTLQAAGVRVSNARVEPA